MTDMHHFEHADHSGKISQFSFSIFSNPELLSAFESIAELRFPARVTTQNNHVFMSIYAVFKLECLNIKLKTNHFAIRAKLFIKATRQAYAELQALLAAMPLVRGWSPFH